MNNSATHIKRRIIKPLILPLLNKFEFDNPNKYFLDYLQINFHIPYKEHVSYETTLANDILGAFYRSIPSLLAKKQLKHDYWHGVHFPRLPNETKHKQIAMQFSGRFWAGDVNYKWVKILNKNGYPTGKEKLCNYLCTNESFPTTKIKDDWKLCYRVFEEMQSLINHYCWNIWKDRQVTNTVARIDISRQNFNTSLNPRPTFFIKKMDDHHIQPSIHCGTNKYTSFDISRLNKQNQLSRGVPVYLKVYDKNWSKDYLNKITCDQRFKTTNVIRKEWRLNRRFYGPDTSHKIDTFQDLITTIIKKPKLLHLIKCMRLNKDVIIKNDSLKYLALHDIEARKQLKNAHKLPLYKLNKLYNKIIPRSPRLVISKNKSQDKNFNKPYTWNRFTYARSLISNGVQEFSKSEKTALINILNGINI